MQFMVIETTGYMQSLLGKALDPIGAIGVLAQLIFGGRMLVQWWASEKRKRSVVPKVFWHMSLWGSVLTLVYGFGRAELPVVMGQITGLCVYVRNLVLLSRSGASLSERAT